MAPVRLKRQRRGRWFDAAARLQAIARSRLAEAPVAPGLCLRTPSPVPKRACAGSVRTRTSRTARRPPHRFRPSSSREWAQQHSAPRRVCHVFSKLPPLAPHCRLRALCQWLLRGRRFEKRKAHTLHNVNVQRCTFEKACRMRARAVFAAIVAMFSRPEFADAPGAPVARVAEDEGLVSAASAFRIRAAFERFARVIAGGPG